MSIEAVEDVSSFNGLKVRIALTEDSLRFQAPNTTIWHNFTMRDMIPSATGTPITISQGETLELTQEFECPSPLAIDFCKLVVWVQADNSGREVLQATRIRIDELGPVSVDEIADLPDNFKLSQNYPNPFNASTVIDYDIQYGSQVELSVYDLGGRKISTVFNGFQPAGQHQVTWNGFDSNQNPVSSGVYFYRLTANSESITKRMVLLK